MGNSKLAPAVVVVCLGALLAPVASTAAIYPNNNCVGNKMLFAGNYCRSVLTIWSNWDRTQDTAKRDTKLAAAAARIDAAWAKADTNATTKGFACAETTVSSAAMRAQIDAALSPIITNINTGLDLGSAPNRKCGAALLLASANRCRAFLAAESTWVKLLAKDQQATKRNLKRTNASTRFTNAWTKATTVNVCPTAATEMGTANALTALDDDVIRNTTISPAVDDTQFEEVPGAQSTYEKRFLAPVCSKNTPFSFFVKRGSVNKLVMYYQGGGACWDYFTCEANPVFDQNVSAGDNPNNGNSGFADLDNPNNPFKDWNIVFVPYCTGDVHLGDNVATYSNGMNAVNIRHKGFINAKVAEKWAREHFVNPEQVFVTGSSAGAYGALLHGAWLHRVYPASDFAVLGDAGNGVITEQFRLNNFPNWGAENNLPPDIGATQLTVPETTALAAATYPNSRWAHYTSAFDGSTGGQTGFYNVMQHPGDIPSWLSWWTESCAWNSLMRAQAQQTFTNVPSNYRYYIGTGSRHTMWGSNKVYTDTTGGVPTLVDWINQMLNKDPGWSNVEATNQGLLLAGDPRPNPLVAPFQQVGPDVVITCP